jgi:hypothetical protein
MMADQMTVVFVKATGHVLGAITGAGPVGEPTAAAVAGDAMPVHFPKSPTVATAKSFAIRVGALDVRPLGFDPRVFEDPRDARVAFATPPDKDPFLSFVNGGDNGEVVLPSGTSDTLSVKLHSNHAATEDTSFWVLFQGPPGNPDVPDVVVAGKIDKGHTASKDIAHGLKSSVTYDALVLVAGLAPAVQTGLTPP